ncbi:hypothetical protein EOD40_11240 [Flavobacterium sufflavum]|uniref:Uncharacterized protein n=1 Tax=Flavobacterium sufflavum TaxID=1921138 RepID=A0A3S2V3J4_9FLAO|nr:hypothetical protein [Flavobacterium sufflavum]RVT75331.1 hypothetical protein EOD40_11240 [Flavobacterium sufflavum]
MTSDLKISFSSSFPAVSDEWPSASLRSAPINFSKEKRKKESHSSSGRFQKSRFFRKNTTLNRSVQKVVFSVQQNSELEK